MRCLRWQVGGEEEEEMAALWGRATPSHLGLSKKGPVSKARGGGGWAACFSILLASERLFLHL